MTTTQQITDSRWFMDEHAQSNCPECKSGTPCLWAAFHTARLAEVATVVSPDTRVEDNQPRRPVAGAKAANQYGTFSVHPASEAQIRFIRRLLAERDLSQVPALRSALIEMAQRGVQDGSLAKRTASDAIEVLLALPEVTTAAPRASEKQVSFIQRLAAERGVEVDTENLTRQQASETIDRLMALPKVEAPTATLESGIYRTEDGTIFKVYLNQDKTRMLAKRLVLIEGQDAQFEYAGMAYRFVKAEQRMTLEEAKQFGAIYGVCCNCGRTLTDEASIEAGIGPVCATKI